MLRFIVRRILGVVPVLFGLSIVLFTFIHLLPGDPATAILGQHATPELSEKLRADLGLDKPIYVQYMDYLGRLVRGDFGKSYINNRTVLDDFSLRFPATIELAAAAILFATGAGIPLGRYAAKHWQTHRDGAITIASLLGISIPIFVLGYALQYIFGVVLQWLPTGGALDTRLSISIPRVTNFSLIDTLLAGRPDGFVDALRHLILPAIALGSIPLANIARITRAAVIDVSSEDYVRTARAKGLSEWRVERRHIMRNAWLPVLTIVGLQVGSLLAGAVITETVFSWNGVGGWVVNAIKNHDFLVVQSVILLFALIFLLVNLIVDILYAILNPRIRYI
jgi:peptide/nickel transport system permease protein